MPHYTFLEEYDFSGKTVIPFTVHGRKRIFQNNPDHSGAAAGADVVEDGLSISKNQVTDAQSDAAEWMASLNLS